MRKGQVVQRKIIDKIYSAYTHVENLLRRGITAAAWARPWFNVRTTLVQGISIDVYGSFRYAFVRHPI